MTREEHLKFCKVCKNQKFKMNIGIICRLTEKVADFEGSCEKYEQDSDLLTRLNRIKISTESKTTSISKRFINYLIDAIAISMILFLLILILSIILIKINPESLKIITGEQKYFEYILFVISMFCYYYLFESINGKTIGKYLTKTKVVRLDGEKPKSKDILIRTLSRFIPFEPLSFLGENKMGWHDTISKTSVVDN